MIKIFKFVILAAVLIFTALFVFYDSNYNKSNISAPTSTINFPAPQKVATTSENTVKIIKPKPQPKQVSDIVLPVLFVTIKEVSPKSLEELVNSSVIQLYCGYFNNESATFSDISRGTGVIISSKGEILTNRHIIYDENLKKAKSDCFVLKSPFPNEKSQNPKIYYSTKIIGYPAVEKFSDSFSSDKYYNDFAVLKINSKIGNEFKLNLILGFDYAAQTDYSILESSTSTYNFLPIDWDYKPKDGDFLITLGYGVDASRMANKITSTIGKLMGNINAGGSLKPQILLVESNATAGFSGGALINPQSKGFIGLISWITSGSEAGKYTVAIFRDFLKTLMFQDLNFELK
jgi:S1-C subfamily serine protease